jgi:3'-phosphoadenosine 5'-phosphosulfate sulfotransferase (PAPS reductase)/FAD synthetase
MNELVSSAGIAPLVANTGSATLEPRLGPADHSAWSSLRILALAHARTRDHARAVDRAKAAGWKALETAHAWHLMWSGGKDSTAMAHLMTVGMGEKVKLVSEKDDLDYPGELEYVTGLARAWGASLEVIRPKESPAEWVRQHGLGIGGADDMHGRDAGLSKACFYNVVEESNRGADGIFLGLRGEESTGRLRNRCMNGLMYRKRPTPTSPAGLMVCQPIADWTGLDVFAYLFSHGIDPLDVYRCIGLMHRREPWTVRKSWWIPGSQGARGQVTWLRHYWPSLYLRLCEWIPAVKGLG